MIVTLIAVLGTVMVLAAILALHLKSLLAAVVAVGLMSLLASILYLLLAAPDVAMTEAAIGAGLSTMIFIYALRRTRPSRGGRDR